MGEPTGDETGPDRTEAERLATELSRVRWRGLSLLNLDRGDQHPVEVPILEQLAAQAAGSGGQRDRVIQIQKLLDAALEAFKATRNSEAAAFVRQLLADSKGRWPGPSGARGLLKRARAAEGITDEHQFRKLQRQRFVEFAEFLLDFKPTAHALPAADHPPAPAGEPPTGRFRSRTTLVGVLILAVLAVAGTVIGLVVSSPPNKAHAAGGLSSHPAPTISTTSGPPPTVSFRFDNLGSTYPGGTVIDVYPGVSATTADRTHNGSYNTGDVVRALCVTTGRTVKSDPHYNETPRTTNLWVRIAAPSGETQYATLTYGELMPASAKLPRCSNVG